jgi:hypothetical protein
LTIEYSDSPKFLNGAHFQAFASLLWLDKIFMGIHPLTNYIYTKLRQITHMDKLIIKKDKNIGFVPDIIGYLASIKEYEYSYKYYNYRHPGGIFNIATSYVVTDFIELLKELENHQKNYSEDNSCDLGRKFWILVHDLAKFYDSCAEIIIGCSKQHKPLPKVFLWKWLKTNGYAAGDEIFKKTKDEFEIVRKINNKLKHTSNSIRLVSFFNNKSAIMGFYIEAFDDQGSVGPDEEIHPQYNGQNTAISYNFILRNLYYNIYNISNVLKEVLVNHFNKLYNINLSFNSEYSKSNTKHWDELRERMSRLPNMYFPNEFNKKLYIFENNHEQLIFLKRYASFTNLNGWRMHTYSLGDGFTRSFRMLLYQNGFRYPK